MKRRVLRLLQRLGLVGPAFRAYEVAVALRPSRVQATDGLPLPPRRLMVRVAGTADADWFLRSGRAAYDTIAAHVPVEGSEAVLDFGCGCGRVLRYWQDHEGTVTGSDRDDVAIAWCHRNLTFARVKPNGLAPPLSFPSDTFGLVYALSVFTHFTEELQTAWRDELRRVLRPGGRLLASTHGRSYLPRLDEAERARFEQGELVVRDTLAQGFELVALEPEGARGNPTQDVIVLRKEISV